MEVSCVWNSAVQRNHIRSSISSTVRSHQLRSVNSLRRLRAKPAHVKLKRRVVAMTASNLSLRQQWKGLQSTVADKWRDFGRFLASTPPGQVYLAIARFIDKLFEPLRQAWDVVVYVAITWYNNQAEWYNFFIREETKRKWTWSVEFRQELDFFSMCFEGGKIVMAVALYVMVVPAVFWIVVLPPLWVAWIWYPNAFWSPFALGLAIMLPLKFPPWLPIRWLW